MLKHGLLKIWSHIGVRNGLNGDDERLADFRDKCHPHLHAVLPGFDWRGSGDRAFGGITGQGGVCVPFQQSRVWWGDFPLISNLIISRQVKYIGDNHKWCHAKNLLFLSRPLLLSHFFPFKLPISDFLLILNQKVKIAVKKFIYSFLTDDLECWLQNYAKFIFLFLWH
jgi:hypothetical protein